MGASQYDFSRLTGFSQSKIARIEAQKTTPNINELNKLSEIFYTDIKQLSKGQFQTPQQLEEDIQLFGLKLPPPPKIYVLSRAIDPLLRFLLHHLGDKRIIELLEILELKEDIFVFKDSRICIQKVHVLLSSLLNEKILQKSHFQHISELSLGAEVIGEKTHHLLNYEQSPIRRIQILFDSVKKHQNYSSISLHDPRKTEIKLNRFFNIKKEKRIFNFRGLVDDFDRHVWCDYFSYYLKAIGNMGGQSRGFEIFKPKCQWEGDLFCSYELQFDY